MNYGDQIELKTTGQVVIPPDEKEEKFNEIYDEFGLASGYDVLYKKFSRRYLGILQDNHIVLNISIWKTTITKPNL